MPGDVRHKAVSVVFTPFKRGPGASSRLAHSAVCCRHWGLGRQPKKSVETVQMGVVTAQASLGLASCPRGHPSSVHRPGRGANGWHSVGTACHAPLLTSSLLSTRQLDRLDRREAGIGRRRDAWPVLRPSRTFKRRQPAARPRILHTRRHDRDERAQCRVLVRAACEGRLWPQQVHQTDLKACRRRAVVARARDRCRGGECSDEPEATWVTKWWTLSILSRAVLWWGCA